ncbi:hypothetical protein ACFXI3_40005 [Amycolatopsis sp. NPDC059235]|uniref:hypothetical protein n=1 Tax=Amycolatopsis sp. NPDC059235 TaxID=3346782 RepID=UPI0036711060
MGAMAVGLVIEVWRNSPVEDMRAGRHGPDGAVIFAESTALHDEAVRALTAANRSAGLVGFEKHLVNRARPWAGASGRTLKDFGYGHLGRYERYVKNKTNVLLGIEAHTCVRDGLRLYLTHTALSCGIHHKGMPAWPVVVDRISRLVAEPDHPAWGEQGRGARAVAGMPARVQSIDQLVSGLLTKPSGLPVDVLEWLTDHFLYHAAPPFSGFE